MTDKDLPKRLVVDQNGQLDFSGILAPGTPVLVSRGVDDAFPKQLRLDPLYGRVHTREDSAWVYSETFVKEYNLEAYEEAQDSDGVPPGL